VIDNLTTLLRSQFENQFFSGGLVLMLLGSALAMARRLPLRLYDYLKKQFIVEVEIPNHDALFEIITLWLNQHPYCRRARKLTAQLRHTSGEVATPSNAPVAVADSSSERRLPSVTFAPAPGLHFLFHKGQLVWLTRERENSPPASSNGGFASLMKPERYRLRMIGRSQETVRGIIDEAIRLAVESQDRGVSVYLYGYDHWQRMRSLFKRPLDSVILPEGVADSVAADIAAFKRNQEWYRSFGLPYRRGYLFYGIPGSGKTSLISALASEFRMDLFVLNIATKGMDDDRLAGMVQRIEPNSMILLEDVDTVAPKRDHGASQDGVTLSGLLNCIDGMLASDGCILFMTTNHVEKLDPALIRPGRVDMKIEFTAATISQVQRLYKRFFPNADEAEALDFADTFGGLPMAEVQSKLMLMREAATADQKILASAIGAD
jgi:mitochondrial chaperone BCS1